MMDASLIEELSRRQSEDDDRRRFYRLTPLGRRVLELELARLNAVLTIARSKNLVPAFA
jgi:DNA-binding MarR family transcriptional regulator